MHEENIRITTRLMSILFIVGVGIYIIVQNYPLFGKTIDLSEKELSDLSPGTRVSKVLTQEGEVKKQAEDLIYFTTKSEGFDKARVQISFVNSSSDQDIHLGFKDQPDWHYKTKPVYLPLVEALNWDKVNAYSPTLYQKGSSVSSFEEFIKNPPQDKVVGTYFLTDDFSRESLDGYTPKSELTKISVPLRGSHTFYTFLQNERFYLKVSKQDLNWYSGADSLKILVSKDGKVLNEKTIPDDGITGSTQQTRELQSDVIEYQGGNPENGLYKIQLLGSSEVIIKEIESSFSLIVFQGPIYSIAKSEAYTGKLVEGGENVFYTDAKNLIFKTLHGTSLQEVKINEDTLDLSAVDTDFEYEAKSNRNEIKIPKGDVMVDGLGYFSFSKDQFFTPYIYKRHEVKSKADLGNVDFLLTDYVKTYNLDGGWKEAELEFNLADAHYSKGKLSWIIRAPGLKEKGNSILIRDIKVTLEKNPVIN